MLLDKHPIYIILRIITADDGSENLKNAFLDKNPKHNKLRLVAGTRLAFLVVDASHDEPERKAMKLRRVYGVPLSHRACEFDECENVRKNHRRVKRKLTRSEGKGTLPLVFFKKAFECPIYVRHSCVNQNLPPLSFLSKQYQIKTTKAYPLVGH